MHMQNGLATAFPYYGVSKVDNHRWYGVVENVLTVPSTVICHSSHSVFRFLAHHAFPEGPAKAEEMNSFQFPLLTPRSMGRNYESILSYHVIKPCTSAVSWVGEKLSVLLFFFSFKNILNASNGNIVCAFNLSRYVIVTRVDKNG